MTRTPEAKIKPELLVWARNSSGLDLPTAAKKIGVKEERLAEWEEGESRPSIAQLRKAGEVYKRPLAVFFLSEAPRDFQPLTDFRRLPDAEGGSWSPELRLAVRRAQFQQDVAEELYRVLGEEPPALPEVELPPGDPELSGDRVRELLALDLQTQAAWQTPHAALNGWVAALEDLGVLVLQAQGVDRREMRGFSISTGRIPTIVLNGSDAPAGKIFTVLHEFTHLLLHNTGVCDLHDLREGSPTDRVELFCNAVAAAALLPQGALRDEELLLGHEQPATWSETAIRSLAEKYSVSREVIVRRLWSQELTSWGFLQAKVAEYRRAYEQMEQPSGGGGPTFFRMRVRDYGRAYLRLALEAYHRDEINAAQLSDYVEVKLNKLPQLEAELIGSGGAAA
jgi:Zn-dependent peptidase ImmA (M78 family)/DNA-binding XRE family transcriptional regulator